MRRLDARRGAIAFVDLEGGEACPIDRAALLARFHAQEAGGPLVSGAEAFAAMWRAIPALRWLGLIARWRPALWLMERAYLAWLKVRPTLQKAMARGESRIA